MGYSHLYKVFACTVNNGETGVFAQLAFGSKMLSPAWDTGAFVLVHCFWCFSVLLEQRTPLPWWDLLFAPQSGGCPRAKVLSIPQLHHWCEAIPCVFCIPFPVDHDGWKAMPPRGTRPLHEQYLPSTNTKRVWV